MNEFIIQIDKIIKNYPMFRHHTAADRELPRDLPQELWTAEPVWVRRFSHMPPFTPLYGCPYTSFQCSLRHFKLQIDDREDNISTSRLKPCCTSNAFTPTEAPPACSRFPLSPPLSHPRGLVPLFKESQVGQVSDTPHPQSPHLKILFSSSLIFLFLYS